MKNRALTLVGVLCFALGGCGGSSEPQQCVGGGGATSPPASLPLAPAAQAPSGCGVHNARLEIFSQEASTAIKPLFGCQPPIGGYLTVSLQTGEVVGICHELLTVNQSVAARKDGTLIGEHSNLGQEHVTYVLNTVAVFTYSPGGVRAGERRITETFTVGVDDGNAVDPGDFEGVAAFTTRCEVVLFHADLNCDLALNGTSNPQGWTMEGTVPFRLHFTD